jgi:hypothetical protein
VREILHNIQPVPAPDRHDARGVERPVKQIAAVPRRLHQSLEGLLGARIERYILCHVVSSQTGIEKALYQGWLAVKVMGELFAFNHHPRVRARGIVQACVQLQRLDARCAPALVGEGQ